MSAAELPKITLRYAWNTGSEGQTYASPHEALNAPPRHHAYPLLRLFIDPSGKIVHSEVVA